MLIRLSAIFIALLLIGSLPTLLLDKLVINKTAHGFFYGQCEKIWAHRGYSKSHPENSIASFTEAIELGAKGIELDIFYDIDSDDYVVSHDFPYNLKDGKILTLGDVFQTLGKSTYYWLDFKNLLTMSARQVHDARSRLHLLTKVYDLGDKIIVESKSSDKLQKFSQKGLKTSYWVNFNENIGGINHWYHVRRIKLKYLLGHFTSISMDYSQYTQRLKNSMKGLPVLLFTINDDSLVNKYLQDDSVKVILTDENLYTLRSKECQM